MPKAWDTHKAELVQLYISEGKTLKEVQETLRRRHGFKASTRAYRMKIDEWGLRKYKSGKEGSTPLRHRTKSKVPEGSTAAVIDEAPPIPDVDETEDVQLMFGSISIPTGPVKCADLLQMIKGPDEYRYALEILLVKWQPDGHYMKAALDLLQDQRYSSIISRHLATPDVFLQAKTHVPPEELPILMKALMEADLSSHASVYNNNIPLWVRRLRLAAEGTDWDTAKEFLNYSDLENQGPGKTFADCAFIVVAERQLKYYRSRLQALGVRTDLTDTALARNAEEWSRQYTDILIDAKNLRLDLDRSFYRYFIKIAAWKETAAKAAQKSQDEVMERLTRNHEKYREIISIYSEKPTHIIDESLNALLQEARVGKAFGKRPSSDQNTLPPMEAMVYNVPGELPDAAAGSGEQHTLGPVFWPTEAVASLHAAWKAGHLYLKQHVRKSISQPNWLAVLFGSPDKYDSMLGLIVQIVPRDEHIPLIKALLLECSEVVPPPLPALHTFFRWRSVFMQSNWSEFKVELGALRLEMSMSPDVANLVLDSTFTLVGERLLEECKARLYFGNFSDFMSTFESYTSSQNQYLARWSDRELHQTLLDDLEAGRTR